MGRVAAVLLAVGLGLGTGGGVRGEDGVSLETRLERAFAGASQGPIHADLALALAEEAIATDPADGRYRYLKGVALHHALRFAEAAAEFAAAAGLGMEPGHAYLAGNGLEDWTRWCAAAPEVVPPMGARYPATGEVLVGVHHRGASDPARIATAMLPELVGHAQAVFGGVPARTAIVVVRSAPEADRIKERANLEFRGSGSGLRDDAGAFGSPMGCYVFENFPDPGVPRRLSEAAWRATLAHEFAHGVAARRRRGLPIPGGVDPWFEEGLATWFEQRVSGKSEAAILAELKAALAEAGGPPDPVIVKGLFQHHRERVNLNYLFAARMVARLERTRGAGVVARLSDALVQPVEADEAGDFDTVLAATAGIDEETLFQATEEELRAALGAEYPAPAPAPADPWATTVTGRAGGAAVRQVLLDQASVGGTYRDFLFALEAPDAAEDYGSLYEAGWGDPQEKGLATEAPAGYWVYAEPYWIIWAEGPAAEED